MKRTLLWLALIIICILASVLNNYICDLIWVEMHSEPAQKIPEIIIYER